VDPSSLAPFRRGFSLVRRRLLVAGACALLLAGLVTLLGWTTKTQIASAVLALAALGLWGYALAAPGRQRALAALQRPADIVGFAHHGVVVNGVTSVQVYVLLRDGAELVIPVRHQDLQAALATLRRLAPHAVEKRV
jgi:hypothetical protein